MSRNTLGCRCNCTLFRDCRARALLGAGLLTQKPIRPQAQLKWRATQRAHTPMMWIDGSTVVRA